MCVIFSQATDPRWRPTHLWNILLILAHVIIVFTPITVVAEKRIKENCTGWMF